MSAWTRSQTGKRGRLRRGNSITAQSTFSSLEIAELTGKLHKNVLAAIRSMLEALGGVLSFEGTCRNPQNGQDYPCFHIPYDETITLVAGYDAALHFKIVKQW